MSAIKTNIGANCSTRTIVACCMKCLLETVMLRVVNNQIFQHILD